MNSVNIFLAGVGGQGLVLTTRIIAEAGVAAGYDVKTEDVIGLSQRGGKIWGSVKWGAVVHAPSIGSAEANFLIGLEPLEALRWKEKLRKGGIALVNTKRINPVPVIAEQAAYPGDIVEQLGARGEVLATDASAIAAELGSEKVANLLLVGMMAARLEVEQSIWHHVIRENVPAAFADLNIRIFDQGYANKAK